ncbi:LrgB family protein [Amphritea sp. HPY]|uniref:LrgB family protein n=1 Tax=Amphritea sp. HPY TaxID=3421652 RepID=UPI003D7E1374
MTEFMTSAINSVISSSIITGPLYQTMPFSLLLTLFAYFAGVWIFKKLRRPLYCPAVLLAALCLTALLHTFSIAYPLYNQHVFLLTLIAGPATVALALPLYQQLDQIKAMQREIFISLPLAAMFASFYAVLLALCLGSSTEVIASLATKSVTAPIALGINQQLGGTTSLMMTGVLVTGIIAIPITNLFTTLLKIKDDRIIGLVLGINGHVIGTVRAFEISAAAGAFASLGMALTGIFTALFLSLAWQLFIALAI